MDTVSKETLQATKLWTILMHLFHTKALSLEQSFMSPSGKNTWSQVHAISLHLLWNETISSRQTCLWRSVYKQDWGLQNVSPGDLEESELDPGQLNDIPRLCDLGLRESFSSMCMGIQKKSLYRTRKNDTVSLESEVNCLIQRVMKNMASNFSLPISS